MCVTAALNTGACSCDALPSDVNTACVKLPIEHTRQCGLQLEFQVHGIGRNATRQAQAASIELDIDLRLPEFTTDAAGARQPPHQAQIQPSQSRRVDVPHHPVALATQCAF